MRYQSGEHWIHTPNWADGWPKEHSHECGHTMVARVGRIRALLDGVEVILDADDDGKSSVWVPAGVKHSAEPETPGAHARMSCVFNKYEGMFT